MGAPEAIALLDALVAQAAPAAPAFLSEALAAPEGMRGFALAFALAPRRLGRGPLPVAPEARLQAQAALPGWTPWRWAIDQAARTLLLTRLPATPVEAWLGLLDRLFAAADLRELVALYQALPLLPHGPRLRARAAEGIRSSMRDVFEAVALDNAYPSRELEEDAWNQMVLKCLFMGAELPRVVGLDARANPTLARMLVDYAHERWAAHRRIDPQLWRLVGPFADAAALEDLGRVLTTGEEAERAAAALALSAHASAAAQAQLQRAPALASAVGAGRLTWQDVRRAED